MGQTIRAFIAVEISSEVRRSAVELIDRLQSIPMDVKWVVPENLHVTLKFLGDVELTETARICDAMKRAVTDLDPFVLTLGGVGAFPNLSRPNTIWLGALDDDRPMVELHKNLEIRLQKLGFRREGRRFQTHLTIGRVRRAGPVAKNLGDRLRELADYEAGKTRVDQIVLFSSQLTSDGPIYQVLGRAKLGV